MTNPDANPNGLILIYTPFGKDAAHLSKVLSSFKHESRICAGPADVALYIRSHSQLVSVILTTEEALSAKPAKVILEALSEQPAWSAIPVLAFFTPHTGDEAFPTRSAQEITDFTDVHFLQKPVSTRTLASGVRNALRDRARQLQTRDLLERLQQDLEQRSLFEVQLLKAHSEAQEAKVAAESANTSKSQFLANMSHEIRTPLGAIMGFADLIAQPETSRAEISNYVSVIRRNSTQLLRIIDDILDLAKVESGRIALESLEFSLAELLADFTSLMGLRAREHGIVFEVDLQSKLPDRVISDPTRLRQILMNVVGNAIKFTDKGRVRLSIRYWADILTFTVTDTGRGISNAQSAELFRPFMQADASTTRKFGGTGLGLVLTKRLSEAMGGGFRLLSSEIGQGSTFEATLQVSVPANAQLISAEKLALEAPLERVEGIEAGRLTGAHILLVEDSPDNQALVQIFLSKAGATIEIAEDGIAGIEKALNHTYDVILMDVQMPRMDGIEAVKLLRTKGVKLPIIALTAHAMKEEKNRCLEAGFSHFLPKPLHKEHLLNLLQEVISNAPTKDTVAPESTAPVATEPAPEVSNVSLTSFLRPSNYKRNLH